MQNLRYKNIFLFLNYSWILRLFNNMWLTHVCILYKKIYELCEFHLKFLTQSLHIWAFIFYIFLMCFNKNVKCKLKRKKKQRISSKPDTASKIKEKVSPNHNHFAIEVKVYLKILRTLAIRWYFFSFLFSFLYYTFRNWNFDQNDSSN